MAKSKTGDQSNPTVDRPQYQGVLRSSIESKKLASVSREAESLYFRLLLVSDGYGRFYGHSADIALRADPQRFRAGSTGLPDVDRMVSDLRAAGLVAIYEADGDQFVQILDYWQPSRADRAPKALFPAPDPDWQPPGSSVDPLDIRHQTVNDKTRDDETTRHETRERGANAPRAGKRRSREGEFRLAVEEVGPQIATPGVLEQCERFMTHAKESKIRMIVKSTWVATMRKLGGDASWAQRAVDHAILKGWQSVCPADWQKPAQGRTGGQGARAIPDWLQAEIDGEPQGRVVDAEVKQ